MQSAFSTETAPNPSLFISPIKNYLSLLQSKFLLLINREMNLNTL